ncbi:MAG: hypothetical protein K0U19_06400 [Proteobacteria bacterium]|nr:hypothetical protein [Pseudomonadota bacterium]
MFKSGASYIGDKADNCVAIFCCYHKKWELVENHPLIGNKGVWFGSKDSNHGGLNSYCREGMNHYDKRRRTRLRDDAEVINDMMMGKISREACADKKELIELQSKAIIPTVSKTFCCEEREDMLEHIRSEFPTIDLHE